MATQNAINTGKPIEVANGGTGLATLTAHAVYVGNSTTAPTALSVGTTGQLLVGATTADPAFAASATGDFTFTSATAGATRTFTVSNTDNSNTASAANILAKTGGASAGDATHQASTTTTVWTWGVDNSVTSPTADPFVIAQGTALGTNNIMSVATSGEINYPLQPAFLAYLPSTVSNVTGNGASFTLGTTTALTKIYDTNIDFNTNGTFTAPVTGRYQLTSYAYFTGCTIATSFAISFVTSNRTYQSIYFRAASNLDLQGSIVVNADMNAADTVTVTLLTNGEAGNSVDILGQAAPVTYFTGFLIG